MFKFLKNKIKDAVDKFKSSAEEEAVEVSEQELSQDEKEQLVVEEKQFSAQDLLDEVSGGDFEEDSSSEDVVENEKESSDEESEEKLPVDEELEVAKEEKTSGELDEEQSLVEEELPSALAGELAEELGETTHIEQEAETIPNLDDVVLAEERDEDVLEASLEKNPVDESSHEEKEEQQEETELKKESEIEETEPKKEEIKSEEIGSKVETELVEIEPEKKESEKSELEEQKSEEQEVEENKGFLSKLFGRKKSSDEADDTKSEEELEEKSKEKSKEKELESERESEHGLESESGSELKEKIIEQSEESEEKQSEKSSDTSSASAPKKSSSEPSEKHQEYSSAIDAEVVKDTTKKKKGFFGKLKEKVVKFKLDEEKFEELFWDFELALMENNVALEVIEKIKSDLHDKLTQENVSRRSIEEIIFSTLKESLEEVFDVPQVDVLQEITKKNLDGKPYVICVVGVNGSGKTTTIGKIIRLLQKNNKSVVVAASDTFRAAAIQQLEEHTKKLGVKLIKHDYNADPSAVAFDAIKHAEAKGMDVVLIDTAGRLQSNSNLMDELKKLVRVNKPDFNLFIGESITGNDCVEQAVAFNEAVGIDGIILSKADIDEKGGAAISVSYVTKKPILYLGVGQTYDDLKPFDKEEILGALGL